ncbi:MAG: hypothetical protein MJA83_10210 [Gammaproteobacteria bacterium]|nr:hypothetical protein [Gammaproteobacteria bacterium]
MSKPLKVIEYNHQNEDLFDRAEIYEDRIKFSTIEIMRYPGGSMDVECCSCSHSIKELKKVLRASKA